MTTTLGVAAALIGAILGLRFKVLILIPAFVMSSTAVLGIGVAHGTSPWSVLTTAIFVMIALQTGYVAGIVIHSIVTQASARKQQSGSIATIQRR